MTAVESTTTTPAHLPTRERRLYRTQTMRYPHWLRLVAILALAGAAVVVFPAAASAQKVSRDAFHDEGSFLLDDFCGVPGLDVRVDFGIDVRILVVPRGRDQLAYFLHQITRTETHTNVANGKSVTSVFRVVDKDLRVTDNGDGTLTVLVLATGNATLYDANAQAIARNPGQVRYELLVDHGGTPSDPSDDEVIDFLGYVKGSTGRSDNFCEAAVAALT